ncbi:DUF397 domain-containing protein [Streptomyces montanisoli]|uniref:DUF397 domain-containing protein n=1 Tax=Streptomyces montanisoli TaxID=2798581 RepID=A0A940MAV1_9ACTN|nr:DUF397 domain-containing protein [Streptomyces montanisoli]MBP0457924.1 DUF397 domain-containing protein [Streptomyces montanisoli]
MSTDHYATRPAALAWFKSSYSGTSGGDCVEVARDLDAVYVRDSKSAGNGAVLRLGKDGWATFIAHAAE